MKTFVFLFACLAIAFAAVSIDPPNKNAAKGKCLSTQYPDLVGEMKYGEEKQVTGKCTMASCSAGGAIQYASCGSVGVPPKCKLSKIDFSKPYPNCCPDIVC